VLYGGPAVQPEYDFAQLPEVRGRPQVVALGPERANEAFEARDPRSFAERHSELVTAAMAIAAATLLAAGFLALRKRSEPS
jgi:hypothetical protein